MPSTRRIGSAHVLALLALFVALGGGAYAVTALPRNSVGTRQVRRHAVTLVKIAPAARHALAGKTGTPGPQGLTGAAGPKGDAGAAGPAGPTGPSDVYIGGLIFGTLTSSFTQVASVTVPAGDYLLQAKLTISGPSNNQPADADCLVAPGLGFTDAYDEGSVTLPAISGKVGFGDMSLVGAASFSTQQTVVLSCRAVNGTTVNVGDARMVATRAGQVHGLPVPID